MKHLTVLDGARDIRISLFVCPACGQKEPTKARLQTHWLRQPECFRNRFMIRSDDA